MGAMTAIRHTVAFALPFAVRSAEEQEFLAEARRLAAIPGVEAFRVLRSLDEQALSLSMDFANRAAYDGYDRHPQHRAFVAGRWLPTVTAFPEADHAIESVG